MDEFVCAMTKTAQGVVYDCQHIREISKANDDEPYGRSIRRILTRQRRFPYVLLWVVILSVVLLVVALLGVLVAVSRRARHHRHHRYYFERV